jgi:SAM-dependent methyltransferase
MSSRVSSMEYVYTKCRICGSAGNHELYRAREMMFGTREEYEYYRCNGCGCLQIVEIPADLKRAYPRGYFSFRQRENGRTGHPFYQFLQKQRCRNALFGRGYKLNRLLSHVVALPEELYEVGPTIRRCGIRSFQDSFLDVGCGSSSRWLHSLRRLGFTNLVGVDPYISESTVHDGVQIRKKYISETYGKFSLITFHHSLEHMPDQLSALMDAKRLLLSDGICLVRIPIVSSYAWEKYGTNWVELDPPRHLYLHSKKSIELLGNMAGFELYDIIYDSDMLQFYGSEQYMRQIPLMAENSYHINETSDIFSPQELAHFEHMAKEVNEKEIGGRAAFYFRMQPRKIYSGT